MPLTNTRSQGFRRVRWVVIASDGLWDVVSAQQVSSDRRVLAYNRLRAAGHADSLSIDVVQVC